MAELHSYDLIVSIVVYKPHLEYLQQTIDSLSETPLKIKITILDNSPTPLSPETLQSKHPMTYICKQQNLGFGRAHNCNIKEHIEQAPYFLILNPDTYFNSKLLPELLQRMETDPSIGLSIPKICFPCGELQKVNRRLPRPTDYLFNFVNTHFGRRILSTPSYKRYLLLDLDLDKAIQCPTISGCFMFFRSTVLKSLGGFDERYFLYLEDTDLSRRAAAVAKNVVFSDLTLNHHWSRGAYRSPRLFLRFVSNLFRYFNKWGWVFDQERDLLNSNVCYYKQNEVNTPRAKESVLKKTDIFGSV
jgi:GT2 family glycosyltransferase